MSKLFKPETLKAEAFKVVLTLGISFAVNALHLDTYHLALCAFAIAEYSMLSICMKLSK